MFGKSEKRRELAREKTSAASEAVEGVGSVNKGSGELARNQSVKNWGAKAYKVHYLYMFGSVHGPSS